MLIDHKILWKENTVEMAGGGGDIHIPAVFLLPCDVLKPTTYLIFLPAFNVITVCFNFVVVDAVEKEREWFEVDQSSHNPMNSIDLKGKINTICVKIELSRGDICVANFIPPCKRGKLGYLSPAKSNKLAIFEAKTSLQKPLWQPKLQTFFQMVFGSGEMKDQIILSFF